MSLYYRSLEFLRMEIDLSIKRTQNFYTLSEKEIAKEKKKENQLPRIVVKHPSSFQGLGGIIVLLFE